MFATSGLPFLLNALGPPSQVILPRLVGDSETPAEPLAMCTWAMRTTNVHRPTADGS